MFYKDKELSVNEKIKINSPDEISSQIICSRTGHWGLCQQVQIPVRGQRPESGGSLFNMFPRY